VSVSRIVPAMMKKLGVQQSTAGAALLEEWPRLVGANVAKHTRPGRLDGGVLVVFVDSSVWLSELQRYSLGMMLARVKKRLGADRVRSITLRLDPEGPGGGGQ
jgi:predicted nucleic acid-binding Zn ribbon protein